ncbi:uncharacterized protein DS421_19g659760 [Arachis hypogaea]|uniref:Uncharacterized protein n=1 Tax=Arachis hypogaea TaxID=3818 RepID=A0A6B9VD95_ARAHY|nr:uncharacterized protein DS421_19g659760 [Arachis hypogaea]
MELDFFIPKDHNGPVICLFSFILSIYLESPFMENRNRCGNKLIASGDFNFIIQKRAVVKVTLRTVFVFLSCDHRDERGEGSPKRHPHERQPTAEEQNQLNRSIKKVRKDGERFTGTQILVPREKEWMIDNPGAENSLRTRKIFVQMVKGGPAEHHMEEDELEAEEEEEDYRRKEPETEQHKQKEDNINDKINSEGIRVEKVEEGLYNIVISETFERRL